MPALDEEGVLEVMRLLQGTRRDARSGVEAGMEQAAVEWACRCGRRRPIAVRLGLRSGGRPRLDGAWFCRKACLRVALEERAARDFPTAGTVPSRVRHRVPLGLILQKRGVVSARELQGALRLQESTGARLGELLRSQFGVPEAAITAAVAAQWGLPMLQLPEVPRALPTQCGPARLFQAAGVFPVKRSATRLLLACVGGPDPALAFALERMFAVRVDFAVVPPSDFERWKNIAVEEPVPPQEVRLANREDLAAEAAELVYRMQPIDGRLVRVAGSWWLRLWLEIAAREDHAGADPADTVDVLYSVEPKAPCRPSLSVL